MLLLLPIHEFVLSTDIDECARNLDNCDRNATCTNTVGDYNCTCNQGYEGSGFEGDCMSKCALDFEAYLHIMGNIYNLECKWNIDLILKIHQSG